MSFNKLETLSNECPLSEGKKKLSAVSVVLANDIGRKEN